MDKKQRDRITWILVIIAICLIVGYVIINALLVLIFYLAFDDAFL